MKNRDLYELKAWILKISHLGGVDFAIDVVKNLKIIEKEIEIFEYINTPSKEYKEKYQPEVEKLLKEFSIKDERGNSIIKQTATGEFYYEFDVESKVKYDTAIKKLEEKEEWSNIVKAKKEQDDKYKGILEKIIKKK